ncbi:MAG: hypothetical protein AVO39_08390 [delta proteobacterium MLS_D]|nr:MAG: hypothetical protein AVO39_08390 [delta proteobacterium MLS_D]
MRGGVPFSQSPPREGRDKGEGDTRQVLISGFTCFPGNPRMPARVLVRVFAGMMNNGNRRRVHKPGMAENKKTSGRNRNDRA